MSEQETKYGILVCVDGSVASDAAIAWASREAVMRQLPITLMHAIPPVVVGWPAVSYMRMYPIGRTTVHSMLLIRPARLLTPA